MNLDVIQDSFPITKNKVYANTAGTGLLSKPLQDWRANHDLFYLEKGSFFRADYLDFLKDTKNTVARFFNANYDTVSLIPSFSAGINILLEGLQKSEKVLVLQDDYPSLVWPFVNRGFKVTTIEISLDLEEQIYKTVKKNDISVLAISLVQYISGIKINIDFLKRLKSSFPDLLIIADGTQFCGTQPFSFANSGIDVLGASAYKWLLGGYGCGFMLTSKKMASRCKINFAGFHASSYVMDINNTSLASQLETGHLDTLNFGSMRFSMQQLEKIGLPEIANHLSTLSNKMKNGLQELGLVDSRILNRDHSTIFNFKGDMALLKKLETANIICSQRGSGLRMSFHIYNTTEEIELVLDALKKFG